MTTLVFELLGGIGLFMMGMVMLTDGLKEFSGDALRRALVRFTGTPARAFASGTFVTLLVQSSSATTVTVIGFVSAGLLTFPQALGVVMGASLGTTGTGWIISVLGLKVSVGYYALPLVGVGAFLKMLGRGRWRSLGLALAGFALIFVGIEKLQDGMRALSSVFDLASLPPGGLTGHLLTMAIGVVMTLLMQSSSAAVATTLTALHAGAVSFEQAASLVIGAAVGTTVTGVLAAIGGSVPAKRTALAHVTFNLATGLIAILLLPSFLWWITWGQERGLLERGAMSLAAFHTAFIALGVVIFLPFVHRFARAIERMLPDRGPTLTRHLDDSVLQLPSVALEATRRALSETAAETFVAVREGLVSARSTPTEARQARVRQALVRLQEFFPRIPPVASHQPWSQRRVSQMHALEHLARLQSSLLPPQSVRHALDDPRLAPALALCRDVLELGEQGLREGGPADWPARVTERAQALLELRREQRPVILSQTANGDAPPARALELLDAMRWLDRLAYHVVRIVDHLREERPVESGDAVLGEIPG